MKAKLYVLQGACRIMAGLPLRTALAIGRGIGWVASTVVRYRRRETVERIQSCLPDRTRKDCVRIYRAMFRNLGMNVVEMMRVSVLGLSDMESRVRVRGVENLNAVIKGAPGGCLGLMAHVGNWEFTGFITTLVDAPVAGVVKPMKDPQVEAYLVKTRQRMRLQMLSHHDSFRDCLRLLKAGTHVAVILDQNRSREAGVFVDFFGRPACTSPGLALLSARSGSPVLPVFDLRAADHVHHDLHFLPAVPPPAGSKMDALTAATQVYTAIIEQVVRDHPEQWTWIHRRWKTRPIDEGAAPADPADGTG